MGDSRLGHVTLFHQALVPDRPGAGRRIDDADSGVHTTGDGTLLTDLDCGPVAVSHFANVAQRIACSGISSTVRVDVGDPAQLWSGPIRSVVHWPCGRH